MPDEYSLPALTLDRYGGPCPANAGGKPEDAGHRFNRDVDLGDGAPTMLCRCGMYDFDWLEHQAKRGEPRLP